MKFKLKKILMGILLTFVCSFTYSHANTQVPANEVTSTVPSNPNCLNSSDTNVQNSINQIDACFANSGNVSFINSLTKSGGNVSLVNDSVAPGNSYYYGTNGSGTKGFFTIPATGVANVATSAPITGGPITTTGTIGITQAGTSGNGYLSSTDWNTFNGKQANLSLVAGTYANGDLCTYATSGTILNCNTSIGSLNYWLNTSASGNVGISTINSVGIGTSGNGNGELIVMSGNVGIGTNNPQKLLSIGSTGQATIDSSGNITTSGIYTTSNAGSTTTPSYQMSAGNGIYMQAANQPAFDVNGSNEGYFDGNKVNFGPNPIDQGGFNYGQNANSQIVNYVTNSNASGSAIANFNASNGTTQLEAGITGTGYSPTLWYATSQAFIDTNSGGMNFGDSGTGGHYNWWTATTQKMTLSNGGNLGIGVTSPINLLDVAAGTVIGTGAGVATAPTNGLLVSGNVGFGTVSTVGALIVSGGNVGIGTGIPVQILQVAGTAQMTGFVLTTSASSGYVLTSDANGNGTWRASSGGSATPGGGIGAVQYNNPLGTLAGTENVFSFNGTNVGIGTTNGRELLEVEGNVGIGTPTAPSSGNALIVGPTYNVGIGTSFVGGAGEGSLTVMNGNVGIGTWLPSASITVNGAANIIGIGGNFGIGTSAPTNTEIETNVGIGTFRTMTSGLAVMQGNVGIGTWIPGNTLQVGTGTGLRIGTSGNITSITGDTNATLSSSLLALDGNPMTLKNVASTAGAGTTMDLGTTAGATSIITTSTVTANGDSLLINFGNVGVGTESVLFKNGSVGIGTFASQYILAPPSGVGGMVIQGNVGIGTWVPGALLQVGKSCTSEPLCTTSSGALGCCNGGLSAACGTCTAISS